MPTFVTFIVRCILLSLVDWLQLCDNTAHVCFRITLSPDAVILSTLDESAFSHFKVHVTANHTKKSFACYVPCGFKKCQTNLHLHAFQDESWIITLRIIRLTINYNWLVYRVNIFFNRVSVFILWTNYLRSTTSTSPLSAVELRIDDTSSNVLFPREIPSHSTTMSPLQNIRLCT